MEQQENFKYTDIIGKLPSVLSSKHGYHVTCYLLKNDSGAII